MKNLSIIFLVMFLFLSGCAQKNSGKSQGQQSSYLSLITIHQGDSIKLDNPEVFIQIWVLFNLEQKKWLNELDDLKLSNQNYLTNVDEMDTFSAEFMARKRKEFYGKFNLTEDDIFNYNKEHFEDISRFLDDNPEYKTAYEESSK